MQGCAILEQRPESVRKVKELLVDLGRWNGTYSTVNPAASRGDSALALPPPPGGSGGSPAAGSGHRDLAGLLQRRRWRR